MSVVATNTPYVKPSSRNRQRHKGGSVGYRGSRLLVTVLCLGAFGPYILGSVRTEQAVVYLAALAAFLRFPALNPVAFRYLAPWAGILVIASLTLLAPVTELLPWHTGNVLAGIDNFLLPVALLFAVCVFVKKQAARPALITASKVIVWASAFNAVLAILRTRGGLDQFLRPFWGAEAFDTTVAGRAEELGRFSGIFNHPAEAGLVYSLALLLAVWIYSQKPGRLYPVVVIIAIGGILTVSKIFIFIGLPLSVWYLFRSYNITGKLLTAFGTIGLFAVVAGTGFVQQWSGFNYFARLFEVPEGNAIEFYTAGRWDQGSTMRTVIRTVLEFRPLTGFGFGGLQVAYDSAWTEIVVVTGLLGAILMSVVFVLLFRQARTTSDSEMRTLTYLVALLLIGASLGIPALTVNRAATLVWIIVALLLLAREPRTFDAPVARRGEWNQREADFKWDPTTGRVDASKGTRRRRA